MIRPVRPLVLSLCLVSISLSLVDARQAGSGGKSFTYQQAFGRAFRERAGDDTGVLARVPEVSGWLDDNTYLETRTDPGSKARRLIAVNASDGSERVLRDYAEIRKKLPDGFDAENPAARSDDYVRFVLSRDNDLYYFNCETEVFRRMTATPAKEQNPRFSPDNRWVAYTREGNLFAYDLENLVEHQFTADGSDAVYNGYASWVYFEEILGRASNYAAFWWSPDSTRIAFMRFDDSPVPVFPIYHADGQHGELERQRYPKAGDANPYVSMGVVNVADGKVVWMDFEPRADHYIAWPSWTPDSRVLMVQWMNREQDTIRFFNCDLSSGKKHMIFEERQASWVQFFEDVYYLKDGSGFLLRSDIDGWRHLYYRNADGSMKKRLTEGNWPVTSIVRVDEKTGYVYFTARPVNTRGTHLLRVRLDGSGLERLTHNDGTHQARISPGASYFIDSFSTISTPQVLNLHDSGGKLVRRLGDARKPSMDEYAWGKAELFTIPSGDGYELPAYWFLPPDFDPSKRYPVVFSVYGGPESVGVRNAWLGLQPHYWAQRGVITVNVDHRGSGQFGKKGSALMHRNLGKWEMADLTAAAKWLRTKPFVAANKIGITGSSYGGYTTMMALTFGADHFNYGIAGSSVTDWKLYDTVYTERYMDRPEENPEGYKSGAVLTWIDRYKGLLRIHHGTTDDNVHMQNSVQVVDWLTSHNRHFELMFYPDSRHGLQMSQRAHLNRENHNFWMRYLLEVANPVALGEEATDPAMK